MDLQLGHKTAFITGASRGIGAETAALLAEEGADIIVCFHRNSTGAQSTAQRVQELGRRAWECQADVSQAAQVQQAVQALPAEATPIDILVVCAGEAPVADLPDVQPDEWARVIEVNLNGAFHTLQACLPLLSETASVVFVASVAGRTGVPHQAHYAAAKAGLINLTKSAARSLAPHVRVNCVAPGMTLTDMGQRTAAGLPPDYAKQKLLLERFAEPREIANCIAFLASSVSSFVTGATLDANGGRYLG